MLKVFLVEDEFVVREGIKKNVDWAAHGYEFVGDAADGELAFPLIQRAKPDIVITDIRMPFMDGLELSRLIRKELPRTEIIILTGFQEFEYAKEAITLGVAEYLTKPINGDDLIREMNKVAERIHEKRIEEEIREKYLKEIEENHATERRELFTALVTGSKSSVELIEQGDELGIEFSALYYGILLFATKSLTKGQEEYSGSMIASDKALHQIIEDMKLVSFDRGLEGQAILFAADSEDELTEKQKDFQDRIKKALAEYPHVTYFGGIGKTVNRLGEIPASFQSAAHAFAHRYMVRESMFMSGDSSDRAVYSGGDEFDISSVNTGNLDRNRYKEFLKLGERDEVVFFVEEFIGNIGSGAMKSHIFRQYITMDAYFTVCEFLEELGLNKNELKPLDVASGMLDTLEGTISYISDITAQAVEMREKNAGDRYHDVVAEVMAYIERNYMDEDLSLNDLASHVNFSPNHLSSIFGQQTGKTFIKYLTDFRMNKAKELLRCTGKKSSVISEEVGYKDPHYFSYLFKKTQGMTPTQYRGHE